MGEGGHKKRNAHFEEPWDQNYYTLIKCSKLHSFWMMNETQAGLCSQRWWFPGLKCWLWGKNTENVSEDTAGWVIGENLGFLALNGNFLLLNTVTSEAGLTFMQALTHNKAALVLHNFSSCDKASQSTTARKNKPHVSPHLSSLFTFTSLSESDTKPTPLRKLVSPLSD